MLVVPWLARSVANNWAWGVNLWGYLPPWYAVGALALGALALAWGGIVVFTARRQVEATLEGSRRRGAAPGREDGAASGAWVLGAQVAACLVFVGLAWLARERIHFLGDTQIRLAEIEGVTHGASLGAVLSHSRAGPLDETLQLYGAGVLARVLGWSPVAAGQIVSCLIGLVYALASVRISRLLFASTRSRLLATALFLTAGYVQLFAGYIENYGLEVTLLALWCAAVLAERDSAKTPLWSHVLLALGILVHRGVLLVVPAHVWVWWRWKSAAASNPSRSQQGTSSFAGRTLTGAATIAVALAALSMVWVPQLREDIGFLLSSGPPDPRNIPLLSLRHLANVSNEFFLLGPAALIGLPLLPRVWSKEWIPRPLLLAALPFWLLALVVRSNFHGLGAVRDWDSLAPAGFFTCLVAVAVLGRWVEERRRLAPLAWACVLAGALNTTAWIAVNASPTRALARAERVAYSLPHMPKAPQALALDALAGIHFERGEYRDAARAHLAAADLFENARYVWSAGISIWHAGMPDSAERLFERAARHPGFRADLIRKAGGMLGPPPDEPILFAMWRAITVAESLAVRARSDTSVTTPEPTSKAPASAGAS